MYWLSHRPNRKRTRRKVENRRVPKKGREQKVPLHILDVQTFSTRELQIKRAAQFRTIVLCTTLFLSIIALVATTRILLNKYLFENPELTISRLEVRTDGILPTQQIIRLSGIGSGESILAVNLGRIRQNLRAHPQIKDVKIEREFPGTLRIAVEERFAIAWLSCKDPLVQHPLVRQTPGGGVLLDEEGIPFVCETLMREYMGLPIVGVPRLQELVPGKRLDNKQVQVGLALLRKSRQALYDLNLEILAIRAPNSYSIVAEYNNQSNVTFGLNDLDRQVANLRAATLHAQSMNKTIGSINLLMTRNIPVIYGDVSASALAKRAPLNEPAPIVVEPVSRPSTAPAALLADGALGSFERRKDPRNSNSQIRSILGSKE